MSFIVVTITSVLLFVFCGAKLAASVLGSHAVKRENKPTVPFLYVLRLAIGNARTREDDVRRGWKVLNECATSSRPSSFV
jgi:hypothetical protein